MEKVALPKHNPKLIFVLGIILGAILTGNTIDTTQHCPTSTDIIIAHYEAVILQTHGKAYRPDLMPPPRKPEGE